MEKNNSVLDSKNGPLPSTNNLCNYGLQNSLQGECHAGSQLDALPNDRASEAETWHPPIPFRQFNLPGFPVEVFPDWLREFIKAVATASQTPEDMAAMLALTVLAVCCQKKVIVQVTSDYSEPTNLYTAIALPPANRKSSVFREMSAPIEEYEKREAERMAPEIAAARNHFKILEDRLHEKQQLAAKAKTQLDQQKAASEAEELAIELANTNVPCDPRLLADDATPEKLTTLIKDQGGRMAVMSPEGDVFELMGGRYSKNGSSNFVVYLKAHSGDTIRVDRTGRASEYVNEPALTVGFTVQPEVIRGLSQKEGFRGRGLLGRFLYSMPESLLGHRKINPSPIPDEVRRLYRSKIDSLLRLPLANGCQPAHVLTLSRNADMLRQDFAERVEAQLAPFGYLGNIADWAGKLVGTVLRIAGLLHMAQNAGGNETCNPQISSQVMAGAIRIGQYLIPDGHFKIPQLWPGQNAPPSATIGE